MKNLSNLKCIYWCVRAALRAVNNEMGKPQLLASLQDIFPELDGMPHASTLSRFLDKIDLRHIEKAHIAMIKDLLRKIS